MPVMQSSSYFTNTPVTPPASTPSSPHLTATESAILSPLLLSADPDPPSPSSGSSSTVSASSFLRSPNYFDDTQHAVYAFPRPPTYTHSTFAESWNVFPAGRNSYEGPPHAYPSPPAVAEDGNPMLKSAFSSYTTSCGSEDDADDEEEEEDDGDATEAERGEGDPFLYDRESVREVVYCRQSRMRTKTAAAAEQSKGDAPGSATAGLTVQPLVGKNCLVRILEVVYRRFLRIIGWKGKDVV